MFIPRLREFLKNEARAVGVDLILDGKDPNTVFADALDKKFENYFRGMGGAASVFFFLRNISTHEMLTMKRGISSKRRITSSPIRTRKWIVGVRNIA